MTTVEVPIDGHVAMGMRTNAAGQFEVAATVNDESVRLMVDTGASHTLLDSAAAERLGLIVGDTGAAATGVGASGLTHSQTHVDRFCVGGLELGHAELLVIDLEHVNLSLEKAKGVRIDGIVGMDVLRRGRAVIDFGAATLYLRPPA